MTSKRLTLSAKAPAREADRWVQQGGDSRTPEVPSKADVFTARLTLDITPELRKRIKLTAVARGQTVANILRQVLEREFENSLETSSCDRR